MISHKKLKELVSYNPCTGIFTRLISVRNSRKGSVCGTISNRKYLSFHVDGKRYYLHRLAWFYITGEWPAGDIDHVNHDPSDNRWKNLRHVTRSDNLRNSSKSKSNKSGVTGVCKVKNKYWRALISVDNKQKYLGDFIDKFEAICARKSAENAYGYHRNHGK